MTNSEIKDMTMFVFILTEVIMRKTHQIGDIKSKIFVKQTLDKYLLDTSNLTKAIFNSLDEFDNAGEPLSETLQDAADNIELLIELFIKSNTRNELIKNIKKSKLNLFRI